MKTKLGRRQFVLSSAGGAAALSMASAFPLVAPDTAPDRVVFVFIPGGTIPETWNPQKCAGQLILNKTSQPLEPIKQHCLLFDDLSITGGGHGNVNVAMGMIWQEETRSTLDMSLAKKWAGETEFDSLHLGAGVGNAHLSTEDGLPVWPQTQPTDAYNNLFSVEERQEEHPLHKPFQQDFEANYDTFDQTVDMTSYLSALALLHDKTRVISLMWGDTDCIFPIKGMPGVTYHEILSASPDRELQIKARCYLTQKLAYLIQLLTVVKDNNNRRLIDSTLVIGVTEMGEGINHSNSNAPVFVAGANHRFRNNAVVQHRMTQMELMEVIAQTYGLQAGLYGGVSDDIRDSIVG